ncbi:MAG: aminotransferase class IV [Armatimonadetes bacterium]|nr:aminotransferase class IV [Armatimonadota bacterium]
MAANAERLVYLNGEFVPEKDANISIFDSALMFGDMVFEMTRSFNGKQFMLREHLERLYRGIKQLQIPLGTSIEEMERLVHQTIEANQPAFSPTDEHRLMINVSRGPLAMYKMVFDGKVEPTVVIADFPVKWTVAPLAHFFDDGIHAVTPCQRAIPAQLLEPKIKNRSRMHYMVANLQVSLLNDPNAWALLLDPEGFVTEGTGSNFFIVKDGTLMTPEPRNILRGTRRAFVMKLAEKLGIPAKECNIESYDVASADEAFFTSTAFTMLPCIKFNGLSIGDGQRGPVFQALLDAFSQAVGTDIEAQTKAFAAEAGGELSGTTIYSFAKVK